jgi:hypothetical protein
MSDTPRVEAVIDAVMKRYPGSSKAALARYFEAVHQELAPLARLLERELREAREALTGAAVIADTAGAEIRTLRGRALPAQLTPPLRRVLGMMLWETGPIAHAMRATGHDVARKAEDEQALVMHWLLGFVLAHGADWHKHAAIALRKMTDQMTDKRE